MVEHSILKLFLNNQEHYDKYYKTLKLEFIKTDYPLLFKLFKSLPANSTEELEIKYLTLYPVLKDGDRAVVKSLLQSVDVADIAEESILSYLKQHLSQCVANELAAASLDVGYGLKPVESLLPIIARLEVADIVETEEIEWVTTDLEVLMQEEVQMGGLHWRLKVLNQSLGPLRKGDFGHIFARLETGKTAMWVSEITYMAEQLDKPILIFFNEESGKNVVWRMYSAVTGIPYLELWQNVALAKRIWNEKLGDKIRFIDQPALVTKTAIERIVENTQPGLIIIDNMDKVKGFTGDRKDLVLHEIYKWGRELAKSYCPVISIGQADGSSHNDKFINESQMADSKTAKPSELDFIIAIGRTDQQGYENVRYINIPKNKLRGDKNTVESMRHVKGAEVLIVPHLSIYQDM
jgi:hypothetical protein